MNSSTMSPVQNFEQHARHLVEPDLQIQTRLQMAMEVRDSLEICHTGEYLNFLKCYFRAFSTILYHITKPQFTDSPEHKLRNIIIEILNRLPHSEVLRPFVQDLLKVAMHVLTTDNEENGLICIRIIFDLLRNFRPSLETEVQPFLDFVCKIYMNFRSTVTYFFESGAMVAPPPAPPTTSGSIGSSLSGDDVKPIEVSDQVGASSGYVGVAGQLNPSTRSFKVVTESPLVVMFLFQLYGRLVQTNIPHLLPLMVTAISVPGPDKVPPHLKTHFVELKGAQVKTVSFLTYLLKSFADYIKQHEENICKSIVNLLVTCSDSVSIRKELLVALKHVLGTDFKRGLFPLIDTLLDERVLVGTGRACFETLRPLAYSLLAEIVHHVRGDLTLSQLSRIIYLFSSNMHDASLSLSIHTTCARLMLNLVEPIFEKGVDQASMDEARILLGRILDAFVGKFNTFKRTIPQLLDEGDEGKSRSTLRSKLEVPVQAVLNLPVPIEHSKEVNDCKHLIKTLVMGMKTIIWSITHAHVPRSQVSPSTHGATQSVFASTSSGSSIAQPFRGMREEEVCKASGVLKSGVHCLALFKEKEEEREMVHLFSNILAIMEPRDLMDMFSLCMAELFECMISNNQLVHIFSALLQAPKVFRPFADVLVNFLVNSKLDVLKHPDAPAAKLVLHLFRFVFNAVAKSPSDCERILQPHVSVTMETCMKNASEVEKPIAYLQLLRTMFRALAGGKFEVLLRDLIPMLQPCLNMLLAMLEGPTGEDMRELLLELCLTLPARLSSLLPHLPRLMRPLVMCLMGSDELINLGLRTLEFWIDSLNPDFLEPSMANVMSEVILALWSHLRPAPYPWGGKSLQLLGKLGGRNRRFLKEPLALECKENPEHGLRLILTFEPSTPFLVPLDRCVNLAVAAVMQKNGSVDSFYRKQALKFLTVCLSSQLNLPGFVNEKGPTARHLSACLGSSVDPSWRRSDTSDIKADLGVKTKTQLMAEKSVFKILLMTVIAASAEPELQEPKDEYVSNICRHFAIIFHIEGPAAQTSISATSMGGSMLASSSSMGSKSRHSNSLKELDTLIFLDALVELLADENRQHAKAALNALNVFAETLLFLANSKHSDALMSRGGPSTPMIVSSPSMSPVYSPPPSVRVPCFEQLLPRLLHSCYGSTWQAQMGGVMGFGALIGKVTVEVLCLFQVRIVRGLVYVLKRLPMYATKEQEETSQVLTQVLRVVNNVDEANSEARRQSFQGVVEYLASELLNANSSINVRKIVQSSLALLASRTGSEVSELLEPLHQPLLQPLILRPLRSKTVDQQVGTVTALNFCLALRPPLLKLTPELINFLQEALQIAEADETVWVVKFMNPKMATSLNKLRTACIELLCTAMAWTDFKTQNHSELRAKIISMFFKSLTSRSSEIVAVAKEGLRQVIQQQKMPKELLQSSLRPILVNLAHTKNLSMPLLQGLARLLELLSNWFNVTLGGKLLEHLKKWLEPDKLAQCQKSWKAGEEPKIAAAIIELFHLLPSAAGKFLDDLVTLTIDLEAALPPGQFYSEINSPYRLPLTKFLNRYPTVAVDYFLARLCQPKYFRRFMYIIRSDAGQPLREELAKSPEKIITNAFPEFSPKAEVTQGSTNPSGSLVGDESHVTPKSEDSVQLVATSNATSEAYFQGLALVKTLVKLMPGWLQSNRVVFDTLVLLWKSPARITRLQNEQELNLMQVKESKWLVKCFLNCLRHDRMEVNVLFEILGIFLHRTRIDFTFLKEFYIIEVAEGYPPDLKKTLLVHFLSLFQLKQLSHDHMVIVMQMLILPMLAHAFQNNQTWEVIDAPTIKTIVDKLLDPPEEISADYDEPLRIELLQLATLLLKHLQSDLVHHRKELIKFGWNHLKREDSASKQWAFVNVCHFLEAYQAPEKIILQVFVALLRTCQPENKMLVKQALDILMPALPRRLPLGDSRMPIWIRYTKKILVEEGHSIPNLIHIFQLIVRHSDLFYSCRAQFVPQMVNSLSRLGLPYNTTAENRRLAIELAGLVVNWEKQRQSDLKKGTNNDGTVQNADGMNLTSTGADPKLSVDGSTFPEDSTKKIKVEPGLQSLCVMSPGGASMPNIETPGSSGQPDEEFKPNAAMEEMIINFLIRVALVIEPKDKEASLMYKQALELLSQALEVWANANVKFNYLEKLLSSTPSSQSKDPSTALSQGLDVMNKVLEKQPHLFVRNNINQISQILEPCFKFKMLDAGNSLCSLLKMVSAAFPPEAVSTPPEVKMLYQKVEELVQKHLAVVAAPQTSEDNSASMISFVLFVIKSLAEVHKNIVDPFNLVRVLQRLSRDMGFSGGTYTRQGQRSDPESAVTSSRQGADVGVVITNLKSVLKLINERVMIVPECKRSVTQILNSLLSEKGTDPSVLLCILDLVKGWVEDDFGKPGTPVASSTFMTPKEVVSLLQKLSQVDKQIFSPGNAEEWDQKYLDLLYGLCADLNKYPLNLRQDVFQKVERQYLLGLRAKNPEVRMKFFSLYHESLGKSLFTRLQYIIQFQDWEALSDVFWLKQGLDLLLAILVEDKPITLAPNSARIPPVLTSGAIPDSTGVQPMAIDIPEGSEEAPLTLDSLVLKHSHFLNEMSNLKVADLIIPLRELAHTDANVAYHLWVLVFPIVWVTLHKEEQVVLAKPMIALLSKDYHKKQQAHRPNVVQALLEGLQLSHPQPRMPSELIKYIGKTYNAWHIALGLLESHVILFSNDSKCSESLAELYRLLNEEDMRCGLWMKRSITAETRAGLSLVQHGYWQRAQSLFYQAMVKATQGTYNNTVPKSEMCLWEEQWIHCATQLSQWDALSDFGKHIENYEILFDSLWKQPDWAHLKDHVIPKAQLEETPKLRIIQAYFALHEKNTNGVPDAENIVGKGVELALEQWWQLPEMSIHARVPLLQRFQQLVEVQESARIIFDIANGNKQIAGNSVGAHTNLYADLKDILETWRLRTPNEWDNMSVWYDLLQWRNEMYNAVIDAFKDLGNSNSQLHHLGFRDKAWNVNKLAHIARKHGLHDVCVTILEKMYGHSTMEVQEAFVKIREQAKAYLEMKGELTSGLNLINSTNLEYFPIKHKAEIFRLKGDFLLKLSDCEGANVAYSHAITLFKNLPKGWISWGNYCDMAYRETHEEIWLEYAVSCFLQGIKFGIPNARSHLARVLYLLSFDTPSEPVGRAFDKYLEQIPNWVWLSWIPQLLLSLQRNEAPHCKLVLLKIATVYPQALYYWLRTYLLERRDVANKSEYGRMAMAQQRMQQNIATGGGGGASGHMGVPEGSARVAVQGGGQMVSDNQLHQGAQSGGGLGQHDGSGSQVQETERPAGAESSVPSGNDQSLHQSSSNNEVGQAALRRNNPMGLAASAASAFEAAKDLMETLRSKHTNLASELEILLTEIGSRFVTLPEERLLAVVNALLHRCYKYPTATTAEVPQSLKKELSGVCRACFSADAVNKHVDFVREYKQDFERDLDPESTQTFPATLADLTERLKHWKNILQSNVEDRFPAVLKLEDESRVLRDFHVVDVEVPGQYFTDQEVAPDHTIKLDRVAADIPIVRRHGSSFRRLTLIGSDGSQRHFIVQTSLTPNARSDERILQLFRVMNRMFDKHKESRRRHICIHTPIIIPVWSQVRMVEDDLMYSTFLEVYENHCARNDREADLPITYFKEQLNQAICGQISPEAVVDLRLQAYNDITSKNIVTDSIFSQYMYKTLLNGNHTWAFKKQFAVQLALSNFMSFMLQIGGRSPNKILFAKNTGKIFQTDFHPAYDQNGMIEFNEPVPFRLTRNLQAFFSQFGVEGLIVSAMCAAAQAVVSPKQSQHLWHHLAMFFRDELISWSWRRPLGVPIAPVGGGSLNNADLKQKVTTNVEHVINRINSIAPQYISEEEENGVDPPQSMQRGVAELVEAALTPRNLCMMDPTWHPWF